MFQLRLKPYSNPAQRNIRSLSPSNDSRVSPPPSDIFKLETQISFKNSETNSDGSYNNEYKRGIKFYSE